MLNLIKNIIAKYEENCKIAEKELDETKFLKYNLYCQSISGISFLN